MRQKETAPVRSAFTISDDKMMGAWGKPVHPGENWAKPPQKPVPLLVRDPKSPRNPYKKP